MKKFFALVLMLALVLSALPAAPSAVAQGDLGSPENPIQVYFVPSSEAETIIEGGQVLSDSLNALTGLTFEVFVPTSYGATIEAMCAAPESTMAFLAPLAYVTGNNRCGIEVGAAAVRNGWPVYWSEFIVRRDSDIYTFGDLEGKTWGYSDPLSTSGYLFPAIDLANAGITPGAEVQTGGHPQTVLAVYNGEVDFGTVYYSPPLMPAGFAPWSTKDLPEPYDLTVDESFVNEDGEIFVGEVRVMDARQTAFDTAPDIIDQVRILTLTTAIPNDTLSFGPEFPQELRDQIVQAIIDLSADTEAWDASALAAAYNWTGMEPIGDEAYDIVRAQLEFTGMSEEEILGGG